MTLGYLHFGSLNTDVKKQMDTKRAAANFRDGPESLGLGQFDSHFSEFFDLLEEAPDLEEHSSVDSFLDCCAKMLRSDTGQKLHGIGHRNFTRWILLSRVVEDTSRKEELTAP